MARGLDRRYGSVNQLIKPGAEELFLPLVEQINLRMAVVVRNDPQIRMAYLMDDESDIHLGQIKEHNGVLDACILALCVKNHAPTLDRPVGARVVPKQYSLGKELIIPLKKPHGGYALMRIALREIQ
jgi:hypothetical protein